PTPTSTLTPTPTPTRTPTPRPVTVGPSITPTFTASPTPQPRATPAIAPKADYQFGGRLQSSAGAASPLTILGSATFGTAPIGGTQRSVARFTTNSGFSLTPTTGVIGNETYTIAMLVAVDTTSGYRRLLDFKHGTSDSGLYVIDGRLVFFGANNPSTTLVTPGAFTQIIMTRDAAKNVTVYVNGVQAFTFNDAQNLGVIDANVLRFFQDNTSGGGSTTEASSGAVARIQLWDLALPAGNVAAMSL
ncbi:MAG: hypothetical protein HY261_00860, partial [Chloroflexi bacterium]|nr:hypothetical protein [Chloroflexota bacterium]